MLVDARRKTFPLPVNALTDALEKNPLIALGIYATVLVVVVLIVAVLLLNWYAGGLRLMTAYPSRSISPLSNLVSRVLNTGSSDEAAGLDSVDWGYVSPAVFLTALPSVLLVGLVPALVFIIGYKRRTEAFWRRWVYRIPPPFGEQ